MSNDSKFVRITNYCLVEYIPNYGTIQKDYQLLYNEFSGINQIFNNDNAFEETKNTQDVSATPMENKLVHLDSDLTPDFINYSNNLSSSDITSVFINSDKVRFHFISGFSFTNFDALGLSIRNLENDNNYNIFSYLLVDVFTIDSLIEYNPKPLFITDAEFDRYIDVEIPSIKSINDSYYNPMNIPVQDTFAAKITPDQQGGYKGFIKDAPITITVDECAEGTNIVTNSNSYTVYNVEDSVTATVPQLNRFNDLGVEIKESSEGDYIEYFATFQGAFPSELIASLNNTPGNDWILIHQLSIFEQVGSDFINTDKLVVFQESEYDSPKKFRPILDYANEAVSYSIDYVLRLVNRSDGEQVIRTASYSSLNPKKYGRFLNKLKLRRSPGSHNVYNRIVQKSYDSGPLFIAPEDRLAQSSPTPNQKQVEKVTQKVYTPIFFNANKISVSSKNLISQINNENEEVIYGQGELGIIINPFDNAFRFKIFTENENGEAVALDLNTNAESYQIVFVDGSTKIKNPHIQDSSRESLGNGEIIFEVGEDDATSILQMSERSFYINSISKDNKESVIYRGVWYKPDEQDMVKQRENDAKEKQKSENNIESKIEEISEQLEQQEQQQQSVQIEQVSQPNQNKPIVKAKNIKQSIPGLSNDNPQQNIVKKIKPKINRSNL
jgi:hypothetical protein